MIAYVARVPMAATDWRHIAAVAPVRAARPDPTGLRGFRPVRGPVYPTGFE